MKKRITAVFISILLILSVTPIVFADENVSGRTDLYASSTFPDSGIMIYEANSENILFEQNADEAFCPGSITKLLTCLTAMDYMKLDEKITATEEMLDMVEPYSSLAHIVEDESMTLTQLIYALMLPSGNDAAMVLAAGAGRVLLGNPDAPVAEAYARFVEEMNKKAKDLGMNSSNFTNSDGYDDENAYSTARDIMKLSIAAYGNETIRKIVSDSSEYIETNRKTHSWESTNKLLFEVDSDTGKSNPYYDSRVVGLKTGFTDIDGRCFSMVADADGMLVFGVYLGMGTTSSKMWSYIKDTVVTTYKEFRTVDLMKESPEEYELKISNNSVFSDDTLTVIPAEEQKGEVLMFTKDADAKYIMFMVNYDGATKLSEQGTLSLEKSVKEGDTVAQILVFDAENEEELARINYVATKDVTKAGIIDFVIRYVIPASIVILLFVGFEMLKKYDEKIKSENGRKTA